MSVFDDTRADWDAREPTRALTRVSLKSRIGVSWHWIGGGRGPGATGSHATCLRQVRAWQYLHQYGAMGAKDIGYNGLICQHARAIEGRGIDWAGSHSPGVNDVHIGYQFMVGALDPFPSDAMIARAVKLRADTAALAPNIRRDWGHRDDPEASTECCGDGLHSWVHSGGPTKAATVTAPGVYPGHALRRGDTGPKVVELQTALGITADGSYGPATEAAVRNYQTSHGLLVDGITGPQTWVSIFEEDDMQLTDPIGGGYTVQDALNRIMGAVPAGAALSRPDADGKPPRLLDSGDGGHLVRKLDAVTIELAAVKSALGVLANSQGLDPGLITKMLTEAVTDAAAAAAAEIAARLANPQES